MPAIVQLLSRAASPMSGVAATARSIARPGAGQGAVLRAVLAIAALVLAAFSVPRDAAAQATPPVVATPAALLMDFDSGTILFERAADTQVQPANLTKIMTAAAVFRALAEGKLKADDTLSVSEYAWRKGGAPSGSTAMFAALNSRIAVSDLLRGMIIQSGNDAAMVLAEGIAGNELAFAGKMNEEAKRIGLTGSTFRNASGLSDPGQLTTARDMARLAAFIIRTYPDKYEIYSEKEFTWNKIRQLNRNPLLGMSLGADGLTTGYLKDSGFNLVGSALQNGQRLVLVLLGAKSDKERAEDARKLLEWGFRTFEQKPLFARDEPVGEAVLFGGEKGSVPLVGASAISLLVARDGSEKLTAKIHYTGPVPAPVAKGQQLATLQVYRGEQVALEVPLFAAADVAQGPLWRRALDAGYELSVSLLRQGYAKVKERIGMKDTTG
ncbi:D-alanyl-D-alanine carboxypeptidase [Ancylobacter sp. 6x-1]|uniref:serine-type D-Ala-D-Ala carboxypeptidase n=1 Tax=Ancylobacter crimeensis TaxID=2579147 RepID=A0ABT0DCX2_9HYPH|nr:D-alanyl-D-alanine carboxypeptidase family protein [Ancylobacter crimeensis]MCK0197811.1 D-alanyl-D-alanine carboxypeptidase [Ancylobacter crimeensis]